MFFGYCYGQSDSISLNIDNKKYNPATLLWYNKPAAKWEEALPVGNGRLGGMVFGKVSEERIQLNEDTYWTGGPYSTVKKEGYKSLPEIQKLVFEGKSLQAHTLFGRTMMGYPVEQQKYQSLADLYLSFSNQGNFTDYKRWLDLETGITGCEYKCNGIRYQREVFSSVPDQVIAIRITADRVSSISFAVQLRGVRNQAHSNYGTDYFQMGTIGDDQLVLTGKSADYLGIEGKLRYEARLKVVAAGGKVYRDDAKLIVEAADEVTLYFTAATNFINYKNVSGDQHVLVEKYLKAIEGRNFNSLLQAHLKDYQPYFKRVSLRLPVTDNSFLPTDERIKTNIDHSDPALAALAYQFGRYILLSSSRPGTQAANLQGIWNENMNPAWDSKYTTNINLEMNYWPAETANLSETFQPFVQLVKDLTDQGSQVAKEHYGCNGWVFHQNTDIWKVAAPMDGPTWGTFTVGGAWLCNELWEHYLFTLDKKYLQEIYPVLKGSVQFFMDFLVQHPNGKWLVTNPSTSPENFPASPGNGPYFDEVTGSILPGTTICAGSSIDMQILTDLFGYYAEASGILEIDKEFASKVTAARSRLVPPQIGKDGSLQEWTEDWEQLEKNHRHSSHMYGLYPGNVLSMRRTPEFINACKAVLNNRGDGAAGWSRAWKVALWARLYDGNRANKIFKGYLKEQCYPQLFAMCGTPMQVDGTFGITAGITEMLIQSHEGVIDLLPALPDEWREGEINGVHARGAFELNIKWKEGKLEVAQLFSKQGAVCRIRAHVPVFITGRGKRIKTKMKEDVIEFPTEKGIVYTIEAKKK
ncbi:MAG: glycoside hydrolase family 95 protein [Bacteroidetes bacterium]|nr:glycoside hydrolase family 95 protein [Bacteroidota bacterium]